MASGPPTFDAPGKDPRGGPIRNLCPEPFPGSCTLIKRHGAIEGWRKMTGHTQVTLTPRDQFLQTAQKELAAFEQRERDFAENERQERAALLQLPVESRSAQAGRNKMVKN